MGGDREWSAIGVIFPYEAPTSHFASDLHLTAPGRWLERLQSPRKDGHGEGVTGADWRPSGRCETGGKLSYTNRLGNRRSDGSVTTLRGQQLDFINRDTHVFLGAVNVGKDTSKLRPICCGARNKRF